ncbi:hypothetical protein [Sphingomonas sp. M1A8_2b]
MVDHHPVDGRRNHHRRGDARLVRTESPQAVRFLDEHVDRVALRAVDRQTGFFGQHALQLTSA